MSFNTDKQTISDLCIFDKSGKNSVYNLFSLTKTNKGAKELEDMFYYPLSGLETIKRRSKLFQFFATYKVDFPFKTIYFDEAEEYLKDTDERSRLDEKDNLLAQRLDLIIRGDSKLKMIKRGIMALTEIVQTLYAFMSDLKTKDDSAYHDEKIAILKLLSEDPFKTLLFKKNGSKPNYSTMIDCDNMLRFNYRETVKKLLHYCYKLDVYIAVAKVTKEKCFCFPKVLPATENVLVLEEVFHPLVNNAVPNNFSTQQGNIIFLTGANMAGKSTFMKTLGIAVYLAHMGFPVPAKSMEFSLLNGIYTSINLADNLGMGISHFYAEVMRVKKVAKELQSSKKLLVMFDELFRGTNVKDACEATIAIVEAFAKSECSKFVISTHIIEAGEVLHERCANIKFLYLPTQMRDAMPLYTYKLEAGISSDRHGMVIINNAGILDILYNRKKINA